MAEWGSEEWGGVTDQDLGARLVSQGVNAAHIGQEPFADVMDVIE